MKIKTQKKDIEEVLIIKQPAHKKPVRPQLFWRWLQKTLAKNDLKAASVAYHTVGMEKLDAKTPCLILMNHSCFLDLEIASDFFYPRPLSIVCTSDGFVGKEGLMRAIGCIPTDKFVTEVSLVRDILYALHKIGTSVLLYPEASYSFDGCCTPLPDTLGRLIHRLNVPVVSVITHGAFLFDPLYNMLQKRKVPVSVEVSYLFSPEEAAALSPDEINARLKELFSFDAFAEQREKGLRVTEPFRADGLNRVLYKCPHCLKEGSMEGRGTTLTCHACGKRYELTEEGSMQALDGETEYPHIPDWYRWERDCVRRELEEGSYSLEVDVDIRIMADFRAIYEVGEGHLSHTAEGFRLVGCGGRLDVVQRPLFSYSLYSDYYWYELGDMICISDMQRLYYCFPKHHEDVVAKTRLAAEELFKLKRAEKEREKQENKIKERV